MLRNRHRQRLTKVKHHPSPRRAPNLPRSSSYSSTLSSTRQTLPSTGCHLFALVLGYEFPPSHMHRHTNTYIHTYIHKYTYTYSHTHTHIHIYTHTHIHTFIHSEREGERRSELPLANYLPRKRTCTFAFAEFCYILCAQINRCCTRA